MTYSEKLKDPRWQRKRLEVMQRDNFSCSCCKNDKQELQIHHLDYEPGVEPWEYPLTHLVTLCRECHAKESFRSKEETMLIMALRLSGIHSDEVVKLSTLLYFNSFTTWFKGELAKLNAPKSVI